MRAENIIRCAGIRIFCHPATDQTRCMNHGVNVVALHGTEQRRQVAHIRGDRVSAVFADDLLEIVAIG